MVLSRGIDGGNDKITHPFIAGKATVSNIQRSRISHLFYFLLALLLSCGVDGGAIYPFVPPVIPFCGPRLTVFSFQPVKPVTILTQMALVLHLSIERGTQRGVLISDFLPDAVDVTGHRIEHHLRGLFG